MFGFFKKKKENENKSVIIDYKDDGDMRKSSIEYNKNNERYMRLPEDACAIILYNDDKVEVVCTKMKTTEQTITNNEMTLMSIAMMLNQPGFGELLRNQFRSVAMDKMSMFNGEKGNN